MLLRPRLDWDRARLPLLRPLKPLAPPLDGRA
jgi:hypothetical protein